jgi:hypothetical protein
MKLPIFKKKKVFRKGGFHTNPDICWEIILYIAFAIVLGALVFSFYLFIQTNQGFVTQSSNNSTDANIQTQKRLDTVLQYFSTRAQKSTVIINSPSSLVDPSL